MSAIEDAMTLGIEGIKALSRNDQGRLALRVFKERFEGDLGEALELDYTLRGMGLPSPLSYEVIAICVDLATAIGRALAKGQIDVDKMFVDPPMTGPVKTEDAIS